MLERFAGNPGVLKLLAATGALTAAAPAVVGVTDLFMGDTNGVNSGELPLNALLGLGGIAGAGLGAAGGWYSDPLGRISSSYIDEMAKLYKNGNRPHNYNPEEVRAAGARWFEGLAKEKELLEDFNQHMASGGTQDLNAWTAKRANRLLGRTGTGALLGMAIATPLSIMAMMDQGKAQPPQPPAAGAGVNQSLG
jgi:hypothetical protein